MKNKVFYNIFRNNIKNHQQSSTNSLNITKEMSLPRLSNSLPYKITRSTTLQYFQFKIIHGYYPTNAYLNKIKIQDTNLCEYCETKSKDTLEQYFVTCEKTQILWEEMKNLIKPIHNRLWNLTNTEILFGVLQTDQTSLTVNWANLILQYYIHLCKRNKKPLTFSAFTEQLK